LIVGPGLRLGPDRQHYFADKIVPGGGNEVSEIA
jgi:hypothetical protein